MAPATQDSRPGQLIFAAGIDLPVKALAWKDADGRVWLAYNDAAWIAQRHDLGVGSRKAVEAMAAGLAALTKAAATR